MEYILLQPLQTNNPNLNVSLVERRYDLTPEEEAHILHEAGGPFAGFVIKKIIPKHLAPKLSKCDVSFKLNVFMKHSNHSDMQQVSKFILFSCNIYFKAD
jgi:hypothetical protein